MAIFGIFFYFLISGAQIVNIHIFYFFCLLCAKIICLTHCHLKLANFDDRQQNIYIMVAQNYLIRNLR
jgi:hypothetical protein